MNNSNIYFRGLVKSVGLFVIGVKIAKEMINVEIMPTISV